MQVYHDRAKTKYITKTFNTRHEVKIPEFQRYPGVMYEPERCFSMEKHLKRGDVLFDIGVSDGWVSAIYAGFVGGENMVLFEPSSPAWANIKADWDANGLASPLKTFFGFVSDITNLTPEAMEGESLEYKDGWPISSYGNTLIEEMQFRSLLSTAHCIPQTTIDDFVERTGIVPRGISIDVEGMEFRVLKGMRQTVSKYHPIIWLSLHDINGALTYDGGSSKEEVMNWLTANGYKVTWLEDYGDSHWICE